MFNQVAVPEADQSGPSLSEALIPWITHRIMPVRESQIGSEMRVYSSNYVLLRSAEDNELKFPNAALVVNIWSLEKRTSVKLREVPSLFINNITIALLIPLDGFRFNYFFLGDSENKWSLTNCPSIL